MKNNILLFSLIAFFSWWCEAFSKEESGKFSGLVGSILSINVDFDIYKIDMVGYKPPLIYYQIMPAPENGIGGRDLTYLGRMPAGTQMEVVSVEKGKWFEGMSYWVKLVSPVNDKLKGSSSRRVYVSEENLDEQTFKLSSIASNVGLYEKGKTYANGAPKLNETWFTLIKLNE